ncbi:MAG: L-rhamnose/proton symporter RhaT, partial [Candidatus Sulfotelmatobacter sp.]
LPVLIVVLVGGFLTNFVWCLILLKRNKTGYQFFNSHIREAGPIDELILETAVDAPSREVVEHVGSSALRSPDTAVIVQAPTAGLQLRAPMLRNYLLCALAGTTWYFQFFFYTRGERQRGRYGFSSWTLHMASIIIFSSLWGIGFKEWKGAGVRAGSLLSLALFLLVASTVIVGYGNYLGVTSTGR